MKSMKDMKGEINKNGSLTIDWEEALVSAVGIKKGRFTTEAQSHGGELCESVGMEYHAIVFA